MSESKLDAKLVVVLGLALVGGLLGARSMLSSAQPPTSTGFGGSEPLSLGVEIDTSPPLEFESPIGPRNPFLDQRSASASSADADPGETEASATDPPAAESNFDG